MGWNGVRTDHGDKCCTDRVQYQGVKPGVQNGPTSPDGDKIPPSGGFLSARDTFRRIDLTSRLL